MPTNFSYDQAFKRNIGWVTREEQQALRKKRAAVGGLGGCGGSYVTTLARLGIGAFSLADFDSFELANFNRQAGARMSTVGKPKLDVVRAMALDINPELSVRCFPNGVEDGCMDEFLDGADIYIDAIDAFSIETRRKVYARCRDLGIPAILAVPLGMGAAFLIFVPDGMSLEEWFRFDDVEASDRIVNFVAGAAPSALHRAYLADDSTIDLDNRDFPSIGLACEICAGVVSAQAVKILLGRGPIEAVPTYHQFDAYTYVYKKGVIPGGNSNPLQRKRIARLGKEFAQLAAKRRSVVTLEAAQ
jgi:molybdopterin/thiamine biosynthesis adenylyltransferase